MKKFIMALAATIAMFSVPAMAQSPKIWTGSDAVQKCLTAARSGQAGSAYVPRVQSRSALAVQRIPAGGACLENAFVYEETSGNTRVTTGTVFVAEGFEYGTSPQGGFRMTKCNNPFTGLYLVGQENQPALAVAAPTPQPVTTVPAPTCDESCKVVKVTEVCGVIGGSWTGENQITCNKPATIEVRRQLPDVRAVDMPGQSLPSQPVAPLVLSVPRQSVTAQQCQCVTTGQVRPAGHRDCNIASTCSNGDCAARVAAAVTPPQVLPHGQNVGNVTVDARGGCSVLTPQKTYLPAPGMVPRNGVCVKG